MSPMHITTVPERENIVHQMAELLVLGFRPHWNAWETIDEALEEIQMIRSKGFAQVALSDNATTVLGWIGGLPEYDGNVWELHPLVVHPDYQRQGIGRALVANFEQQVKQRGGLTIQL